MRRRSKLSTCLTLETTMSLLVRPFLLLICRNPPTMSVEILGRSVSPQLPLPGPLPPLPPRSTTTLTTSSRHPPSFLPPRRPPPLRLKR